jgi:hypothetical protein
VFTRTIIPFIAPGLTIEDAETGELLNSTPPAAVREEFSRTNTERLAQLDRACNMRADTLRLSAE